MNERTLLVHAMNNVIEKRNWKFIICQLLLARNILNERRIGLIIDFDVRTIKFGNWINRD